MQTHIYRLTPAAHPGDSNWDIATDQGTVVVRALSSGDARTVAAHAEAQTLGMAEGGEGMLQTEASAFWNPQLYHVVRDDTGEHAEDGERTVLEGHISRPNRAVAAMD